MHGVTTASQTEEALTMKWFFYFGIKLSAMASLGMFDNLI